MFKSAGIRSRAERVAMQLDYSDEYLMDEFGVSRESMDHLRHYHALLLKWQKAINIVSNNSLAESWERHFVDSLQLLKHIPDGAHKLVDLGSGGGFPAMVLAIARRDLDVTLVDSDQRKAQFLKAVSRETIGNSVGVRSERVENVLLDLAPDLITARGFSSLRTILEMVEPLLATRPALKLLLLKGERAAEEIEEARTLYAFECDSQPSLTNPLAAVLSISNVSKLA